jgi:signal transduction histidine kinase
MTRDHLALVSHELRSPVAALTALAERAAGERLPDDVLRRLVALALAAGRDVERLVSDPQVLSLRQAEVDLADILAGVARPGVSVNARSLLLVCDPTRVRQAVANLVANGLRHGTAVNVEARREADYAVVLVRDDGPGLDAAVDPFAQGVSGAGSTGYGLWLARAIAEAHAGSLELTSSPGEGAEFRLCLPLASGLLG